MDENGQPVFAITLADFTSIQEQLNTIMETVNENKQAIQYLKSVIEDTHTQISVLTAKDVEVRFTK